MRVCDCTSCSYVYKYIASITAIAIDIDLLWEYIELRDDERFLYLLFLPFSTPLTRYIRHIVRVVWSNPLGAQYYK